MRRIRIENFTVFRDVDLKLASSLNVIVGDNGAGKSHLLKLLYATSAAEYSPNPNAVDDSPRRLTLQADIASKLVNVFRPESLGRLTTRKQGRARTSVSLDYSRPELDISYSFATNARSDVQLAQTPEGWLDATPVFIPTRELLSIYPGFVSLYDQRYLEFEETWRDTCALLAAPLTRGPREKTANKLLRPIEDALGGKIITDNGRFYLQAPSLGRFEISLVAEGVRKIGMLARLIANGSLLESGYLFWDEPEANLNPRLIRHVASIIVSLAESGVQVFLGTHSLFLLREIEILLSVRNSLAKKTQFVGLRFTGEEEVQVTTGRDTSEIGDITALEESLAQTDRYLENV